MLFDVIHSFFNRISQHLTYTKKTDTEMTLNNKYCDYRLCNFYDTSAV